jgi:predicted DNA-binding transcriptional regulator YafY
MPKHQRLMNTLAILQDGALHRACDLAQSQGVSLRTIYRDIDALVAAGVPVHGTKGAGYRMGRDLALPPLHLSESELEALHLGIAIVAQSTDDTLRRAAQHLGDKLDAALGTQAIPDAESWKTAFSPFANAARGARHIGTLRAAIKARQKLIATYTAPDGTVSRHRLRPLRIEQWARAWTLISWSDSTSAFCILRLDLIETADPLPKMFVDEPGKTLADYQAAPAAIRHPG